MAKQLCYLLMGMLMAFQANAQQRCATVEYQKIIKANNPAFDIQFENWINNQQLEPRIKSNSTQETSAATYVIPVVVHVIHNGEPVGVGTNISDAQIASQISVLNKDFKRLNSDAGQTPLEFQSVAGNLDIEFVLAKQDPEGLATNGIKRVQGTQSEWTLADNAEFKSLSYWPSQDYLNLWIINFNDPGNFIGYAQFPESNLPGLENSSSDPLTDGVVINYRDVGSVDDEPLPGAFNLEPQFNKGRTATHEIGHFFGLRHIWGDVSGCGGTDYVSDTPPQSSETNSCPPHPQVSCSNNKMFQNYLDYTDDACMNIFTQGQVSRMEIILQNSPRRASLTTSPGSQDPVPVPNDLGLRKILSPDITSCGGTIIPSVEVRNYGTNTITSAQIEFKLDGVSKQIKNASLNLSALAITNIEFDPINLAAPGSNLVTFEILLTNGTTDGKASDNLISHTSKIPPFANAPLFEFFNSSPADWTITNPDLRQTWQNITANNGEANNKAMYINFYDYEEKGVIDQLKSPVLNLNSIPTAVLSFDISHANFPGASLSDRLKIIVISNCDADLSNGVEIFNKSGTELATTSTTASSFAPTNAAQWRTESISLTPFKESGKIQIAFVAQNGNGNNLYLDNVFIFENKIDVALIDISSPSPVINVLNTSPEVRIQNQGSTTISSVKIETKVNGGVSSIKDFTGFILTTGQHVDLILDPIQFKAGINELVIALSEPNGLPDEVPSNNTKTRTVFVNQSKESIPARQNFNAAFQDSWTIVSQPSMLNWEMTTTNKGTSLVYRAFSNPSKGSEAWLVSPVLDFSKSIEASLFFDVSYALSAKGTERLRLLSSLDGGLTFSESHFDQNGNQFSVANSATAWLPTTDLDWKRTYVNLNKLVGEQNVRFAFVVTNDNGNNLYLDNIELYNDDDPSPPITSSLYSVYTTSFDEIKITFNLVDKETSRILSYNTTGQLVLDNHLPDNLNQTYTVDMSGQPAGIYILKLQVANQIQSTKVFISR